MYNFVKKIKTNQKLKKYAQLDNRPEEIDEIEAKISSIEEIIKNNFGISFKKQS